MLSEGDKAPVMPYICEKKLDTQKAARVGRCYDFGTGPNLLGALCLGRTLQHTKCALLIVFPRKTTSRTKFCAFEGHCMAGKHLAVLGVPMMGGKQHGYITFAFSRYHRGEKSTRQEWMWWK